MLYIIIALLAVAAVVYLIAKKVHAAAAIFFVGVLLLMAAALTGRTEFRSTDIDPSGNALYDQLLVVEALFKSRFSGIGMAIMVLFGFVSYMRHIGADAKTVVILSAPLRRFRGSYWLVPVGFLIGNLLSLVIPSASALSLLLVATLLPALIAAGLTPLTVGAIVVTSSTIIPTPPRSRVDSGRRSYRYDGHGICLWTCRMGNRSSTGHHRFCTHVVATSLRHRRRTTFPQHPPTWHDQPGSKRFRCCHQRRT